MKIASFLLLLLQFDHSFASTPVGITRYVRQSEDHRCNHFSRYNEGTKTCECQTSHGDILDTKLFDLTEEEKALPRGEVCLNCTNAYPHEVTIIIDHANVDKKHHDIRDTIVRALFFPCASHSCDLTLIFYGIKYDYSSWKATTWLTLNLKKRVYDVWREHVQLYLSRKEGGGDADLHTAISQAVSRITKTINDMYHIVFIVTAGKPSNPKEVIEGIKKLKELGIPVVVFGVPPADAGELQQYSTGITEVYTEELDQNLLMRTMSRVDQLYTRNMCIVAVAYEEPQ